MTEVFVVVAFWGEYDDYSQEVRGVFSTEADAINAASRMGEVAKASWVRWLAWDAKRKAFLETQTPVYVHEPSSAFPTGHKSYQTVAYEQAGKEAGPEPAFWVSDVEYRIEACVLGDIDPESVKVITEMNLNRT